MIFTSGTLSEDDDRQTDDHDFSEHDAGQTAGDDDEISRLPPPLSAKDHSLDYTAQNYEIAHHKPTEPYPTHRS